MTVATPAAYTFEIAQERFCLWAACRAAQAGSAKAKRIELIAALRSCGVVESLKNPETHKWTAKEYDAAFDEWVIQAQRHLEQESKKAVMYGVVAKLLATYVKGMFLVGRLRGTNLEGHIMPPIDSLLLKGLDEAHKPQSFSQHKWQKLTQYDFKNLVQQLRKLKKPPVYTTHWELEKHWDPTIER